MTPTTTRIATPGAPILNGRPLLTVTHYRLDITIDADGTRHAAGQLVYVMPDRGPEIDVAALAREPFELVIHVGRVYYAVRECEAGEAFRCSDTIIDGEWVSNNAAAGDCSFGLRFKSHHVSPLSQLGI